MCCCGKPTINGEPGAYSWDGKTFSTRAPNPPDLREGDELLYDEPGRCGGLDSHCHHIRLVSNGRRLAVLVRHGAGDDRTEISGSGFHASLKTLLAGMTSDDRYWFLLMIYRTADTAARAKGEQTASYYERAIAERRVTTRKAKGRVRISIAPESQLFE